jgi:hypothetical protein
VVYTDPALGVRRDYTTTVVLEARTLLHVATLREHELEPAQHGAAAVALASWYNEALYGFEAARGEAIALAVGQSGYRRVYWHPLAITYQQRLAGHAPDRRLGLPVTGSTRPGLIDDLAAEIDSGRLVSPDEVFWEEAAAFTIDERGRAQASPGSHDDMVMAMAGAVRLTRDPGAQQQYGGSSSWGRPRPIRRQLGGTLRVS